MAAFEEESKAIHYLTQQYLKRICKIWIQLFEPDIVKQNLAKLVEHANKFYQDVVEESLCRKKYIVGEITELKNEAENLRRLLHVDVELPSYDSENTPLLKIQSEMDKSLEDLREQLRLRKAEICELLLQQEALCEELGESPRELLEDPLPTSEQLNTFKQYLDDLKEEKNERWEKICTLRREIRNFLEILEINHGMESENILLNDRQIKLNMETFNELNAMHSKYANQVQRLNDGIDNLRERLEILWTRLEASPSVRQKFDRYPKYNSRTFRAMNEEVERCERIKKQNLKKYLEKTRDEINELWGKCLKSKEEIDRFSEYTCGTVTDELLLLHELELNSLKQHYADYKQVYDLYADRSILWERMCTLEAKASDPGRFNNRGGQLLKEEKERKMIATKLPKLEQQITELVRDYEEEKHTPFLVYGQNILDVMANQWEDRRMEKEKIQTARKKQISSPKTLRNASSMLSLRKIPSATSLSVRPATCIKRKLKPSDMNTPNAKRSLLNSLNSPSVLKPTTSKNWIFASPAPSNANKSLKTKSGIKKPKPVIGSTLKRRSGRQTSAAKKRKSLSKNNSVQKAPKIHIQPCSSSDGYTTEDTYDSFKKCIEPASRSSVHELVGNLTMSKIRRLQKYEEERERIARLPRPPRVRSPHGQNPHASMLRSGRTQQNNSQNQSTLAATTGRKLKTKNLPIII